jgi:hypothetical protein
MRKVPWFAGDGSPPLKHTVVTVNAPRSGQESAGHKASPGETLRKMAKGRRPDDYLQSLADAVQVAAAISMNLYRFSACTCNPGR